MVPRSEPHPALRALRYAALCGAIVAGCAAPAPRSAPAETGGAVTVPSASELRRAANDALTGPGTLTVRERGGAVVVTGNVESGIDEQRVVRALERLDGVTSVESYVRREM